MRIIAISDTHYRHRQVVVPQRDMIIHAGDLTRSGALEEIEEFMRWFSDLPHKNKIVIAGNHDWAFQLQPTLAAKLIPAGIHYLEDSGCVVDGLKLWGSPVQPEFLGWAYNKKRGAEIDCHWQQIPIGTDVVVTHGPCYGKLDRVGGGEHVGCEMLRRRLEVIRPKLHICGHIHSGYGTATLGPTTMINAAICTEDYRPINAPFVVDLENGVANVRPATDPFP